MKIMTIFKNRTWRTVLVGAGFCAAGLVILPAVPRLSQDDVFAAIFGAFFIGVGVTLTWLTVMDDR